MMNASLRDGALERWESRLLLLLVAAAAGLSILPWLTMPMKWATFCYFLLCAGIAVRRKSRTGHAVLMGGGVAGDLVLVLILQFQRHAIQTAVSFSLSPLQQAHVAFSTGATILYFPLLYLGWKQIRGARGNPSLHRRLGVAAFFLRTAGFLLMFSLLGHAPGN